MSQNLIQFKDGTGHIDTINRSIGRWIWSDDQPHAVWIKQSAYMWTATELMGITDDEWDVVFELSKNNPHVRTTEQRIADDLYWSKTAFYSWHHAKKLQQELPRIDKHTIIR